MFVVLGFTLMAVVVGVEIAGILRGDKCPKCGHKMSTEHVIVPALDGSLKWATAGRCNDCDPQMIYPV
ncbi:MAG: hypothetical protein WAW92_02000 [Minisyncoccia bacterium]